MVTGLLLPIWKRLPNDSTRVYRLQTDAGERIIGRKVSPAWAANATTTGIASVTPEDAFAALMEDSSMEMADMPFDSKRMVYGGFVPILEER